MRRMRRFCLMLLILPLAMGVAADDDWRRTSVTHRIVIARLGDTLSAIAEGNALTLQGLLQISGLRGDRPLFVGDIILLPATDALPVQPATDQIRHVVRRGETLATIAKQYGRTIWDIAAANGLLNPNLIYVGQTLIIR